MRRFRKATIKDVASRAGVSITTVSVFVSGRETVCSPETAVRIRSAISDLNYTPSSLIRSLRKRATLTFGVCMFSPVDPLLAYGGFFFERIWRGLVTQADTDNYSLLHYPVSVRDSTSVDAFLDGRVDGILYHSHSDRSKDERPVRLATAGMPTVLLTRSLSLPPGCGAAFTNENDTADLALSHLWALGHRRIAHIAGPTPAGGALERMNDADDIATARLQAYLGWMQAHGTADLALVGLAQGWRGEQVPEIIAAWTRLSRPPTAVFCSNDALALATIAAARSHGWRVPDDLSVVGVDNTASTVGDAAGASLTSIEPPDEAVGREAVRALVRLIQGAPIEDCRTAVPVTRLVIRDSTAPVAAAAA